VSQPESPVCGSLLQDLNTWERCTVSETKQIPGSTPFHRVTWKGASFGQPPGGKGQWPSFPNSCAHLSLQDCFWAGPRPSTASLHLVLKDGSNDELNENEMAKGSYS
jgi:hypothetical protein